MDVTTAGEGKEIVPVSEFPIWENGGYFVLIWEVIDLIPPNGDLVADGCGGLAGTERLIGYRHDGFWKPADTFKERAELDVSYNRGVRSRMVWESPECAGASA